MTEPAVLIETYLCPLCSHPRPTEGGTHIALLHDELRTELETQHPGLDPEQLICESCLDKLHGDYFEEVLHEEVGELDELEQEVVTALEQGELITDNLNEEFEEKLTIGQRIADKVAAVGGSWTFIIGFGVFLAIWIGLNTLLLRKHAYDPYPYILLNLCLSMIAALQAPVIMMSQNRQAAKDRMRAEQDYQVNLKAELQIRHMHEMLDHLMSRQWERMIEIQRTQTALLEELAEIATRFRRRDPAGPQGDEHSGRDRRG